ncbi:MAG TPA: YfhO family protein, partial [Pyrinomonadaceae bacterium]|nr:YfhO family protein [Pyrinomonadaceae bacterium]
RTPYDLSPARWETAFEQDGVLVVRNLRALPRAWLVAEAEAVDGEEALRRVRGESGGDGDSNDGSARKFEPRRTALLEVSADELPRLPGGTLAPESTIRLVQYRPTRLTLETNAKTATVAVISEIFYPGWEATVDGVAQPIYLTNFLLRGVAVPAGQHRIEMRYRAPAARIGALISLCTLLLIILLSVFARRARRAHARDLGDYQVGR